jgi:hypothetical protein
MERVEEALVALVRRDEQQLALRDQLPHVGEHVGGRYLHFLVLELTSAAYMHGEFHE